MQYINRQFGISGATGVSAQPVNVKTIDMAGVVDLMNTKSTTVSKADSLAALTVFFQVLEELAAEGTAVKCDAFSMSYSIQGTYNGPNDYPTPDKIRVVMSAGEGILNAVKKNTLQKVAASSNTPLIDSMVNNTTGSLSVCCPRDTLCIKGRSLKLGGESLDGVYFIASDGTEVKAQRIIKASDKTIEVVVPPMADGDYKVQVRTTWTGKKSGETLFVGEATTRITVQN